MDAEGAAREQSQANEKDALVARVKFFQQTQPQLKHKWWAFCAAQGKIDFDPSKHDASLLRKFFESLEKDLTKDGTVVNGKGSSASSSTRISEKIFVAGVPTDCPNEDAIRRAFAAFGSIQQVEMKFDATGFRGFCFVTFGSVESARAALAHRGRVIIQGKAVDCKPAVPKEEMEHTTQSWEQDWSHWLDEPTVPSWPLCEGGMGWMNHMNWMGPWMNGMNGMNGMGGQLGCSGAQGPSVANCWWDRSGCMPGQNDLMPWHGSNCSSVVLRLRGLPHDKNCESEIRPFFKDFKVVSVLAKAGLDKDGKPKGEAYVEFADLSEATRALNTMQYATMGMRYIELFNSTPEEMGMASKEKARNPAMADQPTTGTLRMRGLPFKATAEDICCFFSGYPVEVVVPSVSNQGDGRPSGEAFVEFSTVEVCVEAFHARQHSIMQQRYVELFPSSPQEMVKAISEPGAEVIDATAGEPAAFPGVPSPGFVYVRDPLRVFAGLFPKAATEEVLRTHFSHFGEVDRVNMPVGSDGTFKGFCIVIFKDSRSADALVNCENTAFEGQRIVCRVATTKRPRGKGMGKKGGCFPPVGWSDGGGCWMWDSSAAYDWNNPWDVDESWKWGGCWGGWYNNWDSPCNWCAPASAWNGAAMAGGAMAMLGKGMMEEEMMGWGGMGMGMGKGCPMGKGPMGKDAWMLLGGKALASKGMHCKGLMAKNMASRHAAMEQLGKMKGCGGKPCKGGGVCCWETDSGSDWGHAEVASRPQLSDPPQMPRPSAVEVEGVWGVSGSASSAADFAVATVEGGAAGPTTVGMAPMSIGGGGFGPAAATAGVSRVAPY